LSAIYVDHPCRVPFETPVNIADWPTKPTEDLSKSAWKERLIAARQRIASRQRVLYAQAKYGVLLVFQGMDAAGKDSTIRHVFQGVNPAGCHVTSFKAPSAEERSHDFLWRGVKSLPAMGMIGVHNRSWYEDTLVVRVHPELLGEEPSEGLWNRRLRSIRNQELHLAENQTRILKFFLNVSQKEQRARLISRIDDEHKNWKFDLADMTERKYWSGYQKAYNQALAATSRAGAPWYVIPADNKPAMRAIVAEIIASALEDMPLSYPDVSSDMKDRLKAIRKHLAED